jgi:hypothetical protein
MAWMQPRTPRPRTVQMKQGPATVIMSAVLLPVGPALAVRAVRRCSEKNNHAGGFAGVLAEQGQDDIGSCPICLDVCERRTVTACGHHFCSDCIHEYAAHLQSMHSQALICLAGPSRDAWIVLDTSEVLRGTVPQGCSQPGGMPNL